jgi:hypothetical protein
MITYPDDDNSSLSMNNLVNDADWLVQVQSIKVETTHIDD